MDQLSCFLFLISCFVVVVVVVVCLFCVCF